MRLQQESKLLQAHFSQDGFACIGEMLIHLNNLLLFLLDVLLFLDLFRKKLEIHVQEGIQKILVIHIEIVEFKYSVHKVEAELLFDIEHWARVELLE
jgi:hypothetical protein